MGQYWHKDIPNEGCLFMYRDINISNLLMFYIDNIIEQQFFKDNPSINYIITIVNNKYLLTLYTRYYKVGVSDWIKKDTNILHLLSLLYDKLKILNEKED